MIGFWGCFFSGGIFPRTLTYHVQKLNVLKLIILLFGCLLVAGCTEKNSFLIQNAQSMMVYEYVENHFNYPGLTIGGRQVCLSQSFKKEKKMILTVILLKMGDRTQLFSPNSFQDVGTLEVRCMQKGADTQIEMEFTLNSITDYVDAKSTYQEVCTFIEKLRSAVSDKGQLSDSTQNVLIAVEKTTNFTPTVFTPSFNVGPSVDFKNKGNETLYRFYPSYPIMVGGAFVMAGAVVPFMFSGASFQGIIASIPYAVPALTFEIQGPYRYESYPFQTENGYLVRFGERLWCGKTEVSTFSNPSTPGWAVKSQLVWDRIGVNGMVEELGGLKVKQLDMSFQFARNDFFVFTSGLGYQAITQDLQGPNFHYGMDLFYSGFHFRAVWNIAGRIENNFLHPLSHFGSWEVGYHLDRFEFGVGYQMAKISSDSFGGQIVKLTVWY